ncbi:MAG: SDR family NAD(P)-dependent oxidoreductase [Pseudomonadota bacterium]
MQPRKVLITGSGSGIGRACTHQLLEQGHQVVGVSRSESSISHNDYRHYRHDLTHNSSATALKSIAKENPDIDALISNAGAGHFGSLENFSAAQIQASIDLNLVSHMLVTHAFIATLKSQARANVIFIGSESALKGGRQGSVYCAAKFGLRGFAQSLRDECYGANVHVGIVNPGMVRTAFFDELSFAPGGDAQNALTAEDVAAAIELMLNARDNAVIDEINLSPLKKVVDKKPKLS